MFDWIKIIFGFSLLVLILGSLGFKTYDHLSRNLSEQHNYAGIVTLSDSKKAYRSGKHYHPARIYWTTIDSKGEKRTERFSCKIKAELGSSFQTMIHEERFNNGDVELTVAKETLKEFFCS